MLEIRDLRFGFSEAQSPHLDSQFSVQVSPGSLVFLLGANGSGKTTLLKTLSGLHAPLAGQVTAEQALYLPAHPDVSDWLTGGDVFDIFQSGKSKWTDDKDLEELEVRGLMSRPLHRLSLGEQKRVFLAASFQSSHDLLLLDEPLNSLDWNMESILEKIFCRHLSKGRTLMVAAHQLHWLIRFNQADLWFIKNFSRLKSGPIEDVLTSTEVRQSFNFDIQFTDNPIDGSRLMATSPKK